MLNKHFSLLFYLKKQKNFVRGNQPVYMRITIDSVRVELSTQRVCQREKWNSHAGRANGTKEETKTLNTFLDSLQTKVYEAHRSLIDKGEPITVEKIKNILRGNNKTGHTLMDVFTHHNNQMAELVDKDFSTLTLKRYRTSFAHTQRFLKWKYQSTDIDINKLNYEFISDYAFWLKSVRNCNHNSTMKYLACVKKIILVCVKNGWLERNPFTSFKLTKQDVNRPILTESELKTIASKQFTAERLNYVRDIFLFSCFTGLAYIDVQKLKKSEVKLGVDNEMWVFTSRKKTDTASRIPLLPISLQIIKRYQSHPQCITNGRLLPVISNQKMNSYLKEIADVCGIGIKLTFHIARHTFATTVTLNNGVPIESVSKMLGHKSLRTTQHYAKILDRKVSEDMKSLKDKMRLII